MRRVFTLDGPSRERLIRTLADALVPRSDVSFAYVFGSIPERRLGDLRAFSRAMAGLL